jgi:deoxyribonuclease-1-like protein
VKALYGFFGLFLFPLITFAYEIPPNRNSDNLIVGTYNIKWIGQEEHDFEKLAKVIQHFDICGIVEVKNEVAIPKLVKALETLTNKDWGYTFGVRTHRPEGKYHEAYATVWRRDSAQLGDGIISNVWDPYESFRNDPYIISFVSGNFDFSLVLVHTRWSDDRAGTRAGEIDELAEQVKWMKAFLPEADYLVAGDFNYPSTSKHMKDFARDVDLTQVDSNEETTFKRDFSGYSNDYDRIYISTSVAHEHTGKGGTVDVTKLIYGDNSSQSMKKSKKELSDHLPVWAEFSIVKDDDD